MERTIYFTELEKNIMNKIHRYIQKNQKVGIETISKECFVSKGAIVKLAKKLGYSGYSEMYYMMMASNKNQKVTDFYEMIDIEKISPNQDSIHMLVELLYRYRNEKIHLDSLGLCDVAREYYLQKLLMFGFHVVSSYHFSTFHKESPGLFCFMSFSGSRVEIFDRINVARENGFQVLVLTAKGDSPLATIADHVIELSGERSDKKQYKPNFFVANLILLLEMALAEYSKRYLS